MPQQFARPRPSISPAQASSVAILQCKHLPLRLLRIPLPDASPHKILLLSPVHSLRYVSGIPQPLGGQDVRAAWIRGLATEALTSVQRCNRCPFPRGIGNVARDKGTKGKSQSSHHLGPIPTIESKIFFLVLGSLEKFEGFRDFDPKKLHFRQFEKNLKKNRPPKKSLDHHRETWN